MNKVKVAVVGHGHLGRWHTQKAAGIETSDLIAIVEPFNQGAVQQLYPEIKVVSSLEEVIDEVDAAIIVTPTSTHFELVKLCLEKKKHVFCEKPLCSTFEQAMILKELQGDCKLQVGHSERCHKAWEEVRPLLAKIKDKKTMKINRYAPFKGRATDVDVVQDLMIHDIDLMLFLMGKKPIQVSSIGHKIRTDKWDHVTSHFIFEEGDQAIITSGRNHVQEVRELEVMSSQGCLQVDLFKNTISHATNKEFSEGVFVETKSYDKRDHLLIEQTEFYDSILNDKPEMVNFDDGAAAVYFVGKVLESLDAPGPLNV